MQTADTMTKEAHRIKILHHYSVLDTPPNEDLDGIAALAAHVCGTPIALISLVDENRQWFKSKVGLDIPQTPRSHSFCAHALDEKDIFLVPDARNDRRFADNPLVTGDPGVRFYAGAPLHTPEEATLGTLCVIDRVPRELTFAQQWVLKVLARQVVIKLGRTRMAGRQGFSEESLLRPGLHNYSLEELRALVCTNAHRCALWSRLSSFLAWPILTRQFSHAYIGGDPLTEEPFPPGVDVILEAQAPYHSLKASPLGASLETGSNRIHKLFSVNLRFWVKDFDDVPSEHRSLFIRDLPSATADSSERPLVRIDLLDAKIDDHFRDVIDPLNVLKVPRDQWSW